MMCYRDEWTSYYPSNLLSLYNRPWNELRQVPHAVNLHPITTTFQAATSDQSPFL